MLSGARDYPDVAHAAIAEMVRQTGAPVYDENGMMTRGTLTTFSIANDVAKYFAIIPAMFAGLFVADGMASGPLSALNIMGLNSPQSAILSTVIFNALVIVALIPLALKGVSYRPAGAASLLKRNILIYGVGGLIAPFMGIKLIDMVINAWRLV